MLKYPNPELQKKLITYRKQFFLNEVMFLKIKDSAKIEVTERIWYLLV